MPDRNWGRISSGATFESLATTLVFFEDPGAALFGRRGKDGGQDARSSDGKRVFQAKHHQDGSAAKAIADAKKEAAKIAKYRKPGHSREPQWRGVTCWRLVTNAAFNPTDKKTWDSKVVPLFAAQGLSADYWEQANLNALLDKHPEVDRAYFQNATRAFLSLPEVRDMLPGQEPFLRRDVLGTFVGRASEIQSIRSFLDSDNLFLVVHGAGGVGKTRVVMETGEQIAAEGVWQVLWGNVASMEASGTWFEAIVPERPTLLIVDEPENEQILRVLAEQIGTKVGRASQWKIVITVRSPKDPVLKFLFGPRMKPRVEQLCVAELPLTDAESMCMDLINTGKLAIREQEWRNMVGKELAKRFSSHPVWLTLAVHVLESSGDLAKVPQTAVGLAEYYLGEITNKQSDYQADTVLALLRWVALIGTLNREDDTTVELIAQQAQLGDSNTARKALASLVDRRALSERGARNRFVELKPDVLRDHVLLKWLSIDVGYGASPVQPSEDATQLAEVLLQAALGGRLTAFGQAILTSLARTELVLALSGQTVPLLGPFMSGLESGITRATASTRMGIAEMLVDIAVYRPEDTVKLSRVLRTSQVGTERIDGIFGARDIGHDDVVLELAWPVFHAAFGARSLPAREQVLAELCELAEAEFEIVARRTRGLPNDGKRAKDLIGRTLEGGPQFWSDFEDAAATVASRLLNDAADRAPTASRLEALKALMKTSLSIERRQTWSDEYTFHIQTSIILPSHPAWATRAALKAKIKTLLGRDETPQGTRVALWELLAEAHRNVNQCRAREPEEDQTTMRRELLEDLTWACSVLATRSDDIDEISAAHDLWDWHVRFENDPEIKVAAEALDKLYKGNELAAEFEWLLSRDAWDARGERALEKAEQLAPAGREAIEAFLQRATTFFDSERELYQVFNVAYWLGAKGDEAQGVRDFILAALSESEVSPRSDFAAIAGNSWAATRRRSEPSSAFTLIVELTNACGSELQKINLLQRLYGQLPRPPGLSDLLDDECVFVRSHENLFTQAGRAPAFIACIAWGLDFDWTTLKAVVERVLDKTTEEQVVQALATLVDAVYWAVRERDPALVPPGLGVWVLDQLLRVPDIDSLSGTVEWHINEVLKRVGKAPLTWLPGALRRRRDLEIERGHGNVQALSHHMRLSRFVAPIHQDTDVHADVRGAICGLLDLVSDTGSVGYYLYAILRDIDPHGLVVPEEVAGRFRETDDHKAAWRLARIGGGFAIGTPAWRTIAKPVLVRAARADTDERRSLYSALTDHDPRSWSGTPGEVPDIFTSAVESARQRLEAETDSDFRPFWEWRLAIAEARLRDEEEHAKEERGE